MLACACLSAAPCLAAAHLHLALSQLPYEARSPIAQVLSKAILVASDAAANDELGYSAAINSAGNTIVVGAPTGNSFQGAVYVFVKPASGWANATQTAEIAAPVGATEFGQAVSIDSSGSMIAVTDAGNAYLFSATSGNWSNGATQIAELTASDSTQLGTSIAIAGSGEIVVVGDVNDTVTDQDQGAVYVFVEPTTGWANMTQTAKLTSSTPLNNENLGSAVAISGNTIAAGAWDYALGQGGPGSVYVFEKSGSSWTNMTQTARLTASDGRPLDALGISVSISGETIVAGAPDHKVGSNAYQGALYVFVEPTTGWVNSFQTAELTVSNGVADASFGESAAISGGYIVGGAYCQTVGANTCQGELYAYAKPHTGWVNATETYDLTAKGGSAGDELGWSASLTSTGPVAIGGAFAYENYTGAVYVFEK